MNQLQWATSGLPSHSLSIKSAALEETLSQIHSLYNFKYAHTVVLLFSDPVPLAVRCLLLDLSTIAASGYNPILCIPVSNLTSTRRPMAGTSQTLKPTLLQKSLPIGVSAQLHSPDITSTVGNKARGTTLTIENFNSSCYYSESTQRTGSWVSLKASSVLTPSDRTAWRSHSCTLTSARITKPYLANALAVL